VMGSCEHGNGPSGFTEGGECIYKTRLSFPQAELFPLFKGNVVGI
jgi:hypothetical protein